jgi:hypothetical protein
MSKPLPPAAKRLTRDSIDGLALWRNIEELLLHLTIGHRPVYARPEINTPTSKVSKAPTLLWDELTPEDVKRYQVLISAQMKLLNKVLPDLKSVDFNDVSEAPRLSSLELAQKIQSLMGKPAQGTPATPAAQGEGDNERLELPTLQ